MVKHYSKTQSIIALSSGESELASIVKGSAELLGMRAVLNDFGVEVSLELESDSTAAIGIVSREGLGKVRHLDVADLWVQAKQRSGEIRYDKVPGKENTSDILTKGVDATTLVKHVHTMGFRTIGGRHKLAPMLTGEAPDVKVV